MASVACDKLSIYKYFPSLNISGQLAAGQWICHRKDRIQSYRRTVPFICWYLGSIGNVSWFLNLSLYCSVTDTCQIIGDKVSNLRFNKYDCSLAVNENIAHTASFNTKIH